jgi:hypothetical protein
MNNTYPYKRFDSYISDNTGYLWGFGQKTSAGATRVNAFFLDNNRGWYSADQLAVVTFTANEYNSSYTTFSEPIKLRASGVSYFNGGNVGIGTTSPVAKLDINGTSNFAANVYHSIGGQKFFAGSGGTYSYFYTGTTALNIINSNDTSTLITILNGGNVGIGTTSPTRLLQVNGTAYLGGYTTITGNVEIVKAGAYLYLNSTNSDAELLWLTGGSPRWAMGMNVGDATENLNIYNYTTATINFSILKASGNVGIGTTNPGAKLQVDVSSATGIRINGIGGYANILSQGGHLEFYKDSTPTYAAAIGLSTPATALSNDIQFATYNGSSWSARMTLQNGGNVGIGTTSPASPLTVQSNANQLRLQTQDAPTTIFANIGARYDTTHPFTIEVANNNSTAAEFMGVYADGGGIANRVVFPTGNVGIGTTSPSQLLELYGTSTAMRIISTSGDAYIRLTDNGVRNWDLKVVDVNDYFEIGGTNSTSLVVKGDGNVGIGTTSPVAKLDVAGNSKLGSSISNVHQITGSLSITGSVTGINTESFHPFLLG